MIILKSVETKKECKGIYWRGSVNQYLSSHKSLEVKKSLRLLKRASCPGCEQCEWLWEFLEEDITYGGCFDCLENIEHGKLYTYNACWHPGPYEYPNDGEMEVELIEVDEKEIL